MPTGEHCWKKNSGSNQQPLDFKPKALPTELGGLIYRARFKLLLYSIASMFYVASLHNHAIVSGMYHIAFIKTENIVVDEIGRIICSHLLAHDHTYFK